MHKKLSAILLLIIFIESGLQLIGQEKKSYTFKRIGIKQGLSSNEASDIFQDSKGFLWFGTSNGLNKYDGREIIHFYHNPLDTNTITNNSIYRINEDKSGNLWIATRFGISKINLVTGQITRLINPDKDSKYNFIRQIKFYNDKALVGTFGGGLNVFTPSYNSWQTYSNDTDSTLDSSLDYINDILVDSKKRIWLATFGGLAFFDYETGLFKNYEKSNTRKGLNAKVAHSLIEYEPGILWISTANGINAFDIEKEEFTYNTTARGDVQLSHNFVLSFHETDNSEIWITTQGGGLTVYNKLSGITSFIHPDNNQFLPEQFLYRIFQDRSGVVWVSSNRNGIFYHNTNSQNFYIIDASTFRAYVKDKLNVSAILVDRSGNRWIGTRNNGLIYTDAKGKNSIRYFRKKGVTNSLSGNFVTSIAEDSNGFIWVGTSEGLNRLNVENNKIKKYSGEKASSTGLRSSFISDLFVDCNEDLWIGTVYEGIAKYKPGTDSFKSYGCARDSDTTLLGYNVQEIIEDSSGMLWIATMRGLSRLNKITGKFVHSTSDFDDSTSIPNNSVLSLFCDSQNNIWAGTYGGGLSRYDQITGEFKIYSNPYYLPRNIITSILPENDSIIWLGTTQGLTRFNYVEDHAEHFDIDDGLQGLSFAKGAAEKMPDGTILFGGTNGINIFKPSEFIEVLQKPVMRFKSVKVAGEETLMNFSPLTELNLNYLQNTISIEFVVLDYANPAKNSYSYKMEGLETSWNFADNRNYANYSGIPPGEYLLKVSGANSYNVWNEEALTLAIVINPPFYRTWWFYLLLIAFILSLVFLMHRYIVKQKVNRLLEIEKIRRKAADDFHDQLGHKLTKISLYTELLKRGLSKQKKEFDDYLFKINSTANSLYDETKDFIWSLDPAKDSLEELAIYLKDFGENLFDKSGIEFRSGLIPTSMQTVKIPMEWKRQIIPMFKEIMNNILKHSSASSVNIDFSLIDKKLIIAVKDDGVGFDPSNVSKGLGLNSIKERAAGIGAYLKIDSCPGDGTKIEFLKTI